MRPTHTRFLCLATAWCCTAIASLQLSASAATLTNRYSFTADATDAVSGQNGALSNATISAGQVILASPTATPSSDGVTGQYVDLPDGILTNYTSVTIEAWVTPTHDDVTGGAFWSRIWDFGNSDGANGTHSFWFRGGSSTASVVMDMFYPGFGNFFTTPSPAGVLGNGVEAHVVFTSDAVTQRGKIYVNGVEVAVDTTFATTPAAMGLTTNNWLGRSQFAADTFWMGSINEFRVYSGELNPLEVAASFAAGPDTLAGAPGTITNINVSVGSPITVGSSADATVLAKASGLTNQIKINYSATTITFTSGNTNVLRVDTNGVVTGFSSGTANVIATVGSLSATQSVQVISVPTTMKHRYSFTADATDSINGQNGTLFGAATITDNQVLLDGVAGSYVDLPANLISATNIANKAVTMEAWATFNAGQGAWTRLFDFGTTSGANGANYLFMTPSGGGQARAVVSDANPGYNGESIAGAAPLVGRTNVHVAVVYNPNPSRGIIALYVDGSLVASVATARPFNGVVNNSSYLGRALYTGDPWLAGAIDEFRIYDGELDRFQLAASFQGGPNSPSFNVGTFQSLAFNIGGTTMPVDQLRQASVIINFSAATNINLLGDAQLTLTSSDTNVATISATGAVTTRALGSTVLTATYKYIVGATTNTYTSTINLSTYIPQGALVHRYSFSETSGDTVTDSIGTAHGIIDAFTTGLTNATRASGQLIINTNTTLGAADTYVDLPNGIISTLVSNVTIESWATVNANTDWQRVWDFGSLPASPTNAAEPNIFLTPGPGGSDNPRYDWRNGNVNSSVAWTPGTQAHIVVVHSGTDGSAKLYFNGVLRGSSTGQNLPLSSIDDTNCFLGRSIYSAPYSLPGGYFDPYMVGSLNEVRIYRGLLTDAEIAQQFAIGPDNIIANVPLSSSVSGGNLTLSWPTYGAHFALESTTSLSPAAWSPVVGVQSQVGTNYQMTVPVGTGNRFFRLKR